jgi:hypothetical protein
MTLPVRTASGPCPSSARRDRRRDRQDDNGSRVTTASPRAARRQTRVRPADRAPGSRRGGAGRAPARGAGAWKPAVRRVCSGGMVHSKPFDRDAAVARRGAAKVAPGRNKRSPRLGRRAHPRSRQRAQPARRSPSAQKVLRARDEGPRLLDSVLSRRLPATAECGGSAIQPHTGGTAPRSPKRRRTRSRALVAVPADLGSPGSET